MFSERLLKHFRDPKNAGELDPPAVVVEVSNPACGDILQLSARVDGERIADARYKIRGCTASIGMGSAVAEWLPGRTFEELRRVSTDDLAALVGGLTPETRHAAVLCRDGIQALLAACDKR